MALGRDGCFGRVKLDSSLDVQEIRVTGLRKKFDDAPGVNFLFHIGRPMHFDIERRATTQKSVLHAFESGEFHTLDINLDEVGRRQLIPRNVRIEADHRHYE